jgi:hypothetical protein
MNTTTPPSADREALIAGLQFARKAAGDRTVAINHSEIDAILALLSTPAQGSREQGLEEAAIEEAAKAVAASLFLPLEVQDYDYERIALKWAALDEDNRKRCRYIAKNALASARFYQSTPVSAPVDVVSGQGTSAQDLLAMIERSSDAIQGKNELVVGLLNCNFIMLEAADIIRQLLSRSPADEAPDGWQLIDENTPKKTEILVWRKDQGIFVAFYGQPPGMTCDMYDLGDHQNWWTTDGDDLSGDLMPTHWMPSANAGAIKSLQEAQRALADYSNGELNAEQEHDCIDRIDTLVHAALRHILPAEPMLSAAPKPIPSNKGVDSKPSTGRGE